MTVTSVTARVPAKINLQLAVGPLRPDGYHGLVTVFHAVSLFDEVTVVAAKADSETVAGPFSPPAWRRSFSRALDNQEHSHRAL